MAVYRQRIGNETLVFNGLRELMAKASIEKSGDQLAGIAATSSAERVAAQMALADVPLRDFLEDPLVAYESDEVTRLIIDSHDRDAFSAVAALTVGGFREWLLSWQADSARLRALAPGLTPEMVAAVSKIMRNADLMAVAGKVQVVTGFRTTLGLPGRLGSRLQPNHPTDDARGILASTVDGLLYGIGDAVIGINPATDNVEQAVTLITMLDHIRQELDIAMQSCVLTHVTNSIEAIDKGAPLDLVFQSIAGTEAANASFGVTLALLAEAEAAAQSLHRGTVGRNVMYFETGQGAALSAEAHHGIDQQTVEARAYAVARAYQPLLVNTVVGFIGPEYIYDGKQVIRAGLEDHFCAKLLGVPMGCDVCYTNHTEADQNDVDILATLLASCGVNFLIAVPGADDIMLNYQSLSYHDVLGLRHRMNLRPAPEFEQWLQGMGLADQDGRLPPPQALPSSIQKLLA